MQLVVLFDRTGEHLYFCWCVKFWRVFFKSMWQICKQKSSVLSGGMKCIKIKIEIYIFTSFLQIWCKTAVRSIESASVAISVVVYVRYFAIISFIENPLNLLGLDYIKDCVQIRQDSQQQNKFGRFSSTLAKRRNYTFKETVQSII